MHATQATHVRWNDLPREDSVVADAFSPVRSDWIEKRDDYLRR